MTEGNSGVTAGVRPGDVLAGKYRVERVIGKGGMGVVVAAHHIQLDQRVALKFLLPSVLGNAEAIGRFAREARAAVKIKSEHVARIIDVGELESGSPYMVMEYLDGSDLHAVLAARGPLPVEQAVSFVLQACEALAEAHVLGIVHRDLKPANLFLAKRPSGDPIVKVLDFGISKSAIGASEAQLTRTAALMGSPFYMSPEQIQSSKTVDLRSDIWALGIVLYEMIGGRPPFQGDTFTELILSVLQQPHAPLRTRRPDVVPAVEAVLDRCLAKDPARRFGNVGELAAALAPFGPPHSDGSVRRIRHVLGQAHAETGPVAAAAATALDVAGTLLATGSNPGMVGAGTTSKAVSSDAMVDASARPNAGKSSAVLIALGLVGVIGIGIGGLAAWHAWAAHDAATASPDTPGSPPLRAPAAAPLPPPPSPPASATATISTEAMQAGSPSPALASATAGPVPLPASSASSVARPSPAAARPAPKVNCDPPYVLDADNHRQYKHECLGKTP
jgi:serine/threonine-protein kinase